MLKLTIALGGGLGLLVLVALCIKAWSAIRLGTERDRIREAGEPVSLDELEFPALGDGRRASEWLAQLAVLAESNDDLWCWEGLECYPSLEQIKESSLPFWDVELGGEYSTRLDRELAEGRDVFELATELENALSDARPYRDPESFPTFHLHAAWRGASLLIPHVLDARSLAGFDFQQLILKAARAESEESGLPVAINVTLPSSRDAMQVLRIVALSSATDGDEKAALEALQGAFHVVGLYEGAPFLGGFTHWSVHCQAALEVLEQVVFLLPSASHLETVDELLEGIAPRATLRRALVNRRAYGLDLYEMFAAAVSRDGRAHNTVQSALFAWTGLDQLELLVRCRRGLEVFDQTSTSWELKSRIAEEDLRAGFPKWVIMAPICLPPFEDWIDRTLGLETELQFARIALLARREGRTVALERAVKIRGPFDGEPVRFRFEDDGTLVLWSVGGDLHDDDGQEDDIVWYVYVGE